MTEDVRSTVVAILAEAGALLPPTRLPPLARSKELLGEPEWYPFERRLWDLGEKIRQLLVKTPRLRRDPALQRRIAEVAFDRRGLRGRQSFIMLLGCRDAAAHAPALAAHLDDDDVAGQVIFALYRMRAGGYREAVRPFLEHDRAWIRGEARRYVAWDAGERPER